MAPVKVDKGMSHVALTLHDHCHALLGMLDDLQWRHCPDGIS